MYWFGIPEFAIILVFANLCILFLFLIRKRLLKKNNDGLDVKKSVKISLSAISIGLIFTIAAIIIHLQMRSDVLKTIEILRPISEMTAAPIFLLTILILMLGLTSIVSGIMILRR